MRLIDAKEALQKIDEAFKKFVTHDDALKLYSDARLAIITAPTIEAEPVKHAQWIGVQNGRGCCSNCHRQDGIDPIATHCRYCGAKMDGGNDHD